MRLVPCKLCGEPTTGSTGAAGIRWPFLCQPCKDSEDAALLASLRSAAVTRALATTDAEDTLDKVVDRMLPELTGGA